MSAIVIVMLCFIGAVTVLTFVPNCVVLIALTFGRRRQVSLTFSLTLTVSLLTADVLVSLTAMPLFLFDVCCDITSLGETMRNLYSGVDILFCSASIFHLTGLACDRYLAVCRPFLHRRLTVTYAMGVCLLCWLTSALMALSTLLDTLQEVQSLNFSQSEMSAVTWNNSTLKYEFSMPYLMCATLIGFVAPLTMISGFHLAILRTLRASRTLSLALDNQNVAQVPATPELIENTRARTSARKKSSDVITTSCDANLNCENIAEGTVSYDGERRVNNYRKSTCEGHGGDSGLRRYQKNDSSSLPSVKKEHGFRAEKALLCLVLSFVLCWLPFHIEVWIEYLAHINVPREINWLITSLNYICCALNPFLYYRFNKTVQTIIRRFLRMSSTS